MVLFSAQRLILGNLKSVVYGTHTGDVCCRVLYIKEKGVVCGNMFTGAIELDMGGSYN